jgi:hypothetical protein
MRDDLGHFGPGEPVVHAAVDVKGELVVLSRRDQGGNRHQAAVVWREVGSSPQIAEQHAVGVAGEHRRCAAHLGLDGGSTRRVAGRIDGEKLACGRCQPVRRDAALGEDVLGDAHGRHSARPAAIEGEVRDDSADLGRLHPVVEGAVEMPGHLLGVAAGDQGGNGDQAAIPRHELGALPDIAEQHVVGVGRERRRNRLHVGRRHPLVALLGLGPGSQRTERERCGEQLHRTFLRHRRST